MWGEMDGIPLVLLLAARATLQSTVVLLLSACPRARARWKSKSAIHFRMVPSMALCADLFPWESGEKVNFFDTVV
jgi:hypothetical protein